MFMLHLNLIILLFFLRSMSELTRSRIQLEYDQMSRNTADPIDPYKFAVYKIMGRCELNKRTLPHITSSTEDWLWLQVQYHWLSRSLSFPIN